MPVPRLIRSSLLALLLAVAVSCGGQVGAPAVDDPSSPSIQIEVAEPGADETVAAPSTMVAGATGEAAGSPPPPTNPSPSTTTSPPADASPSATSVVAPLPAGTPGAVQTVVAQAVVPRVVARTAPEAGAPAVAELVNPIASGTQLVFRAVDGGAQNPEWLQVLLPVEPNGTTGWIPRADVALTTTPYRIEIDRASYTMRVFYLGDLWIETTIGVGTGRTPTPVGDFYLLELLAPPDPTGPYGPYAFGLSGFSEVLDGFAGADEAIIGLHGTNQPSSLGTDASYGCIRLANDVIRQLAANVPLGTPVHIT